MKRLLAVFCRLLARFYTRCRHIIIILVPIIFLSIGILPIRKGIIINKNDKSDRGHLVENRIWVGHNPEFISSFPYLTATSNNYDTIAEKATKTWIYTSLDNGIFGRKKYVFYILYEMPNSQIAYVCEKSFDPPPCKNPNISYGFQNIVIKSDEVVITWKPTYKNHGADGFIILGGLIIGLGSFGLLFASLMVASERGYIWKVKENQK